MHPSDKIVKSLAELEYVCRSLKKSGKKLVLTSGCFDLLHGGHLEYLCEAGKHGCLIIGVNSDEFVRKIKGINRPIRGQDDRAFLMAGFFSVTLVVVFDCDYDLIAAVEPDVYVASSTSHVTIWEDKRRVSLLESLNVQIIEIGSKKTDSTTDIIKRAATQ